MGVVTKLLLKSIFLLPVFYLKAWRCFLYFIFHFCVPVMFMVT